MTSSSDITQVIYDKFSLLPLIPYNIVKYLMENDEQIWKLLEYSDADAYRDDASHLPLTTAQKGNLVYNGVKPINDCRIFLDLGQDDSFLVETALIRIGMPEIIPSNYVRGNLLIGMEVLTHYKVSTLSNYQPRVDSIVQRLIQILNGADIVGIGRLFFDARINNKCRAYMIGQIPYRGKALVMCANILG